VPIGQLMTDLKEERKEELWQIEKINKALESIMED
jgi:hypothetical protein